MEGGRCATPAGSPPAVLPPFVQGSYSHSNFYSLLDTQLLLVSVITWLTVISSVLQPFPLSSCYLPCISYTFLALLLFPLFCNHFPCPDVIPHVLHKLFLALNISDLPLFFLPLLLFPLLYDHLPVLSRFLVKKNILSALTLFFLLYHHFPQSYHHFS